MAFGPKPIMLSLTQTERESLQAFVRRPSIHRDVAMRVRVVLACADLHVSNTAISQRFGVSRQSVVTWRQRFWANGLDGLTDAPRSGAPHRVSDDEIEHLIAVTLETQPSHATHWATRSMAEQVGLSQTMVSRAWRAIGLQPHRQETFKLSRDPAFVDKVRDVVRFLNCTEFSGGWLAWIPRGDRHDLKLGVVCGFRLGGRDVADGLEQTPVVEPVNPFEGGELDGLDGAPRPAPMDHLDFEEADDGFSKGIVVRIADTADRRFDVRLGEALGAFDRDVFDSSIARVDEAGSPDGLPFMENLLQGIEHEVGPGRARHAPANDPVGEGVDHEGHMDEARPDHDIREVADPQGVRPRRLERSVHPVGRVWR
jgi:transposase